MRIGISEAEQDRRHLTPHSGRHFSATLLAEEIGPELARKITRHRSMEAFAGYSTHDSPEAIAKAREALNFTPEKERKAAGEEGKSD